MRERLGVTSATGLGNVPTEHPCAMACLCYESLGTVIFLEFRNQLRHFR